MPLTEGSPDPIGMQKLLQRSFIGTCRVSVAQLELTSFGRPLRQLGVQKLQKAIREHGFIESFAPLVCLTENLASLDSLPSDALMRVIDGNHRVAALKANDEEDDKAASSVIVRVHTAMDDTMMRMVAEGERRWNMLSRYAGSSSAVSSLSRKFRLGNVRWNRHSSYLVRPQLSCSQMAPCPFHGRCLRSCRRAPFFVQPIGGFVRR